MEVRITRKATKQLDRIPSLLAKNIFCQLSELSKNPYPSNCRKLRGEENYRIRVGVYRAIYTIDKKTKRIIVLRVKHRSKAYR